MNAEAFIRRMFSLARVGRGRHVSRPGFAVLAIVSLALVMAAFAHRAVGYADGGQPIVYSGTLPDGTVLQVCLSDESGSHDHYGSVCEFCHIAGSVGLPPRFQIRERTRDARAGTRIIPARSAALPPVGFPSAPLRGPPLLAA
ncbi:MAG: hypothetical protein H6888_06710 [Nitratireductor sp.]|nr:hypothetical protein [Nitratireductor sp.]